MKAVVWSNIGCHFCEMAKTLLEQKGIEYEERNLAKDWKVQDLLEAVPTARSVPQIFVDDKYIGNYDNLVEHFKNS
jgi:glutaredoxin 3|tara:strand:- start:153 stop:380 length:228 start_codon:yes stop_codon:yes gene_type:complete